MKKIGCTLFALLICLCLFACGENAPADEVIVTPAKVDILKVGKADCIVIDTGTKIVMIDTAEEENLPQIHSYMEKNGYEHVDVLILTHYDKDHIGGATDIISRYGVDTVIESSFVSSSIYYQDYHNLSGVSPIKLKENYTFKYDSCSFEIFVPKKTKYAIKEDNNSSLVISMEIGEKRFLFCGDAMELRIAELIEDKIGQYDFVKLPYHGNYLENYSAFLDEVKPAYGAITCSKKNPASEEALSLLEEYGVEVYETRCGEINVSTDGKELNIIQQ